MIEHQETDVTSIVKWARNQKMLNQVKQDQTGRDFYPCCSEVGVKVDIIIEVYFKGLFGLPLSCLLVG